MTPTAKTGTSNSDKTKGLSAANDTFLQHSGDPVCPLTVTFGTISSPFPTGAAATGAEILKNPGWYLWAKGLPQSFEITVGKYYSELQVDSVPCAAFQPECGLFDEAGYFGFVKDLTRDCNDKCDGYAIDVTDICVSD